MRTLIDALKGLLNSDYARRAHGAYWKTQLERIIAEHERSETDATVKCRCGNPAEADHTCPFKSETNDSDDLCNCCDSCRHECAMDI